MAVWLPKCCGFGMFQKSKIFETSFLKHPETVVFGVFQKFGIFETYFLKHAKWWHSAVFQKSKIFETYFLKHRGLGGKVFEFLGKYCIIRLRALFLFIFWSSPPLLLHLKHPGHLSGVLYNLFCQAAQGSNY